MALHYTAEMEGEFRVLISDSELRISSLPSCYFKQTSLFSSQAIPQFEIRNSKSYSLTCTPRQKAT
jgi:hypothetical protein